jgi:hypothetical protein
MSRLMKSKTLSIAIAASPSAVYEFASSPENMPKWARGFAQSVIASKGDWIVETSEGPVKLRFVDRNVLGVLDHIVTLPTGLEIYNPMRVIPNGSGSEVVFTLFQTENLSDKQFADDAELVKNDLLTLRRLLEGGQVK